MHEPWLHDDGSIHAPGAGVNRLPAGARVRTDESRSWCPAPLTGRLDRTLRTLLLVPILVGMLVPLVACSDEDDESVTASGVIETETAAVASQTGGRVESVIVDIGDEVESGAPLIELDTALVQPQLDGAEAAVDAATAALESLTSEPRPEELAVAEARLGVAIALWDGARRAWENAALAVRLGQNVPSIAIPVVPESPAGNVVSSGAETLAGLAAASATGGSESATSGLGGATTLDPVTAKNQAETAYRRAEVAVDAAAGAIEDLKAGGSSEEIAAAEAKVRQAQAALEAIQATRDKATLLAPIDGRVLSRSAHPGELAMPGAVLMRISNPMSTTLTVYVAQDQIGPINEGQEVEVVVDAFEDDSFDGVVTDIADSAEFTPRNVQTKDQRANLVYAVSIAVENSREKLKAGMPAEAKILLD